MIKQQQQQNATTKQQQRQKQQQQQTKEQQTTSKTKKRKKGKRGKKERKIGNVQQQKTRGNKSCPPLPYKAVWLCVGCSVLQGVHWRRESGPEVRVMV